MSARTAAKHRTPVPPGSLKPRRVPEGPHDDRCSITQLAEFPAVSSLTERASNQTVKDLLEPSRISRTPIVQHVLNLYIDTTLLDAGDYYDGRGRVTV